MHRPSVDHHHSHHEQLHAQHNEPQREHERSRTHNKQRRHVWQLGGGLAMLALLLCGGMAMDWPAGAEAASLSIPITQSQLRMLRVLNILANSDSGNNNNNNRAHDDSDDDYSYSADDDGDDDGEGVGDDESDDENYADDVGDVDNASWDSMAEDGGPSVLALSQRQFQRRRGHRLADVYALRETRHRKRQVDYSPLLADAQSQHVEWANPCGGVYDDDDNSTPEDRPSKRQYLSIMRDAVYAENTTVKQGVHGIDVNDIAQWDKHRNKYKFLPKMNSSKIGLKRWYRKMQVYVAAFAYLGRAQHKWEQSKQLPRSNTSHELEKLFLSARRILCELEITINGSYSRAASQEKLSAFTRAEMDEKLRAFLTKLSPDVEPYPQDLKFAKHGYIEMLEHMHSTLEKYVKLADDQLQFGDSNDSSSSSSSADLDDRNNESVSLHEKVMRNNKVLLHGAEQAAHAQQTRGARQRNQRQQSADGGGGSSSSRRRNALKTHREPQKSHQRHASGI